MKNKLKKIYFRPDFYYETANDFCLHLGITSKDIANLTGCHVKTAHRWIKSNNPPIWLLPFLYAAYGHVISSKGFDGWILNNGLVDTPNNRYSLKSVQIETYYWHLDVLKQMQNKLHLANRSDPTDWKTLPGHKKSNIINFPIKRTINTINNV